jgi:hypothetical protein
MEFIDSHPVTSHRIRFQGRTEISELDAAHVKDGNTMAWLVRAKCQPPQYYPTVRDSEDRYRFNIQSVEMAMPLVGEARDAALIRLNRGQPELWQEATPEIEAALPVPVDAEEHLEVVALRDYLAELGELHEGERLVNAVRRLIERRPAMAQRIEDPAFAEAAARPRAYEPDSDVEVVGTLYRPGRKSDLQSLLDQFGSD